MSYENFIKDDENLYRSIEKKDLTGPSNEISYSAFNDRRYQPSLQRAKLCDNDPQYTVDYFEKYHDIVEGGALQLSAQDIRSERTKEHKYGDKPPAVSFELDVVFSPNKKNPTHSHVTSTPHPKNSGAFRKIQQRLAYIANVAIMPRG